MSDTIFELRMEDHHLQPGRLDKILAGLIEDLSRSRLQGLITDGQVTVNGLVTKAVSARLTVGDKVAVHVPALHDPDPQPEDIPLDIVYEDDDLLVINKAVGMVVHPGAGNHDGTLVNALLHHCADSLSGIGGVMRPGIVHRLDKDTSGLIVVAKHDKAHQGLSDQLQDRSLSREYMALLLKVPTPLKGHIEGSIGRDPRNRLKMTYNPRNGKPAKTFFHVQARYRDALSLVACKLESGRTHQIRVHMQALGHPLIGDSLYGPQPTAVRGAMGKAGFDEAVIDACLSFPRQALHAQRIAFIHPMTGEAHSYEAAMPDDLGDLLQKLS